MRLRSLAAKGTEFPKLFLILASYFFLLAPSFLLLSGAAKAGSLQPRVHIPGVVEVEGETVKLSDLLPPDAPADLGEICTRIILGNAPLPASQRVISKGQIEQQLREFPSLMERLEIPQWLIITCKQRRLSASEIQAAIETFMAGEGLHGSVAGLNLQAPVFVTKPDPGLEVRRVEFDRVQRKTRFLLWTSKEPQLLPFYVTVEGLPRTSACAASHNQQTAEAPTATDCQWEPGKTGRDLTGSPSWLSGSWPRVTSRKGESTRQATSSPAVLVTAGKPAKLVVETATLRMTALVTPLQSGVKGQLIRVKNPDTQRVLEGEVVGRDLLQAELAGE